MLKRLGNIVILFGEGVLLLGVAFAGFCIAFPLFQLKQTLAGNPLWFIPRFDRSRR